MEFWGVEVKSGEPLKIKPGDDKLIHVSQACLGEVKKVKENDSVTLFVNVDGNKIVIGTLSPEKCTQISYDLVFEKEFELYHNWKKGSVYFCGYRTVMPDHLCITSDNAPTDSESEDELPVDIKENGKPEPKKVLSEKADVAKPEPSAAKSYVKIVEPKKDDDEDGTSDDDEDDSEDDSFEQLMSEDDSSDEGESSGDDDSSDEDDETPKKAEQGTKRPAESASKTPTEKKAKLVTPEKTGAADGKKGSVHVATPYPSKQAGKAAANSGKSKQQTPPKSVGQVSCKSCSKTFNSENALQSHTKAKHSGGK